MTRRVVIRKKDKLGKVVKFAVNYRFGKSSTILKSFFVYRRNFTDSKFLVSIEVGGEETLEIWYFLEIFLKIVVNQYTEVSFAFLRILCL